MSTDSHIDQTKHSQIRIRSFEDRDEPAVTALWLAVFPADKPWQDPTEIIRRKREVQPELFFVALIDTVVVGTVLAGYDGHRGWIYHVAVDPANRRQGIASALLRHAESRLSAVGCLKVNLQVHSTNSAVIPFYEQLGFNVENRISMGKALRIED